MEDELKECGNKNGVVHITDDCPCDNVTGVTCQPAGKQETLYAYWYRLISKTFTVTVTQSDTSDTTTTTIDPSTTSQETVTTITTTDSVSSPMTSQDADGNTSTITTTDIVPPLSTITVLGAVIGVLVALVAVALITLCIVVVCKKRGVFQKRCVENAACIMNKAIHIGH